jgi:hypothetical protein
MRMAFSPAQGSCIELAATSSTGSSRAAISVSHNSTLHISVTGTGTGAYVNFGDDTVTAGNADFFIPSGVILPVSVSENVTHVVALCRSGEANTVNFSPGRMG